MKVRKNLLTTTKTSSLDFYWIDGRGSRQKLAKAMAKKSVAVDEKSLDGLTILHATFSEKHFILAARIFDLVGRAKTTSISVKGLPTLSKNDLANVFWCFERSLRSRSKDYCGITIAEVKNSEVHIGINITTLGLSTSHAEKPARARKKKPTRHPCQLCYYATERHHTGSAETYLENLDETANLIHATLCPRFKKQ